MPCNGPEGLAPLKEFGMKSLEEKLGYTFQDRGLLDNALTHSSCANESR